MAFSLNNLVKKVANTVQAVKAQPRPATTAPVNLGAVKGLSIQSAPKTPSPLNKPGLTPGVGQFGVAQKASPSILSRTFAQLNPLDNGRTFKQSTPTNTRSVIGQLSHNALTNTAGNLTVKPVVATGKSAFNLGKLGGYELMGSNPDIQATKTQLASDYKQSIPGFFTNQGINATKAIANTPFALAGDIQSAFTGKAPSPKFAAAQNAGARALNSTAAGQIVRPAVIGVENLTHQSKAEQQAIGLDPNATGAQKYFGDPVMGALATTGLVKGGIKGLELTKSAVDNHVPLNSGGGYGTETPKSTPTTKLVPATEPKPQPIPQIPARPVVPKTGVADKQMKDLQDVHKQLVAAESENIRPIHQPVINPVSKYVRDAGGVSSSAYESFPKSLIRKAGQSADRVAQQLGYNSEDELVNALQTEAQAKSARLNNAQLKEQALQNLANGKSEHSADFSKLQQMTQQRQDELSQYPNGKYRQVKVTTKPTQISDAELQSLASTPEGAAKKVGNKVVQSNPKTTLRNADAERMVQEALHKGASPDVAIDTYRKATGADLQTAVRDVKRVASESNLGFNGGKNPLLGTIKLPEVQLGDHGQAFRNADFVRQHETAVGQRALDSYHGLSEHDKTLLKNIETDTVSNVAKKADNPQAFTQAEKSIRNYYDTRHAYDNALGIDVGYRANYLRQIFDKAQSEAKASMPDQVNIRNGSKNPGYKQSRTNDTLNTNVGNALERDIHGSSTNHAKLAYSEGLHQAYPDKVNSSGQLVRDESGAYRQLTNRYGEGITAQKDIADQINSRSRTETTNKGLQKYDKVNSGLKYVKLGGGAFHALTEAGNFIGQQLTSGKLFTDPKASGKVLQTFFSPKTMDKEVVKFRDNGTIDNAHLAGLKIMAKEILADANVKLGGKVSKYTGIQALHDATFQREIPYAKLKMFEQKTKGLDPHNPADLAQMHSAANGINALFGGIARETEGIRPNEFKVLQRFVLATDFTEGKITTALRSINITDHTPAAKIARQAVFGKAILFAAVAGTAGALTGEYKGKTPKEVALALASKLYDPKFKSGDYSVALPSTHIAEFGRPLAPLFNSKNSQGKNATVADRLKGIQKYATNRFAAVPSEALQLTTNKDALGNRIYGKDYVFKGGEKISAGKAVANVLGGFTPIPVSQGINVGTGKTNIAAAVANVAGLRASNDTAYNQDATPVKITTGDNPVTLPKSQAITYNKAVADQKAALGKQLEASSQYKSADSTAQADMKKKLNGYITDYQQRVAASANNIPINKQASSSVQAVASNKLPDNLAKGATPADANYSSPDAEYKALLLKQKTAKYNSPADKIKANDALAKAKAGSTFDKSIRDAYDLKADDLYDYVSNDPNGRAIADKVVAYDDALVKAGIIDKNKYRDKYGNVTIGKSTLAKRAGSSSSGGSRKKSNVAFASALKSSNSASSSNQSALLKLIKGAKVSSPSGSPSKTKLQVAGVVLKKQTAKRQKAKVA